jgi:hypothetical protein
VFVARYNHFVHVRIRQLEDKKMKRKEVIGVWSVLFALGLLVAMAGCNGGGNGNSGPAPADITGVWTGTLGQGSMTVPMTMTITQTGDAVEVTWRGEYPDGPLQGTFAGTYVNGTLTASEQTGTVVLHFSGDTATGTTSAEGMTSNIWLTRVQ